MQKNGIIIRNESNSYIVEDCDTREIVKCCARGKFKEKNIDLVVGDYIIFEVTDIEKCEGIIEEVAERKSYIKRPKIANLTQIVLVISMKLPKPDYLLLDKQLVFAELNRIKPVICFNKIDIAKKEEVDYYEKLYSNIGYEVIKTNASLGEGTDTLKKLLSNNITAFSGNSGVGKSTLINSIFDGNITKQGSISMKNKRGKNTTTATYLYRLDDNSYIADTPGFSTFEISEISSVDLYKYFKEFVEHERDCEFVGCTHVKEQNCGIKKAVERNLISAGRYNSYCKIYDEIKKKEEHKW